MALAPRSVAWLNVRRTLAPTFENCALMRVGGVGSVGALVGVFDGRPFSVGALVGAALGAAVPAVGNRVGGECVGNRVGGECVGNCVGGECVGNRVGGDAVGAVLLPVTGHAVDASSPAPKQQQMRFAHRYELEHVDEPSVTYVQSF